MGFDDRCLRASEEELIDDALSVDGSTKGQEYLGGALRARRWSESTGWSCGFGAMARAAYLPFAKGFATASGKAEVCVANRWPRRDLTR